jgi:hypothetical protein
MPPKVKPKVPGEFLVPKREIRSRRKHMRKTLKTILLAGTLLGLGIAQAQSVKRHPGDVLHYRVTVEGGDIDKITSVALNFWSGTPIPQNQQGFSNGFPGDCTRSSAIPNVFDCSVTIPDTVSDGDYTITWVAIGSGPRLNRRYEVDFHIALVPIENPKTFNFPTKVTVTEQH